MDDACPCPDPQACAFKRVAKNQRVACFSKRLLVLGLLALLVPAGECPGQSTSTDTWLPASAEKLPRWRGFNLLNYFMLADHKPYDEADFRLIHALGFNFVRLPMDYRIWIVNGDWTQINNDALVPIDQAVAFGEKYHIHVCLNFHRAPGYTVAKPPEGRSIWTDPEAQRVCALHWAAFARRYKGIPNERLSFDLFNEPGDVDPRVYAEVVAKMAAAIRQEDPDRLIIADGLHWGNVPCPELIPLHVAQATRGYAPMWLTHFGASWVGNAGTGPPPTWPRFQTQVCDYLYGPSKRDWQSPLVLQGNFPAGTRLDFVVGTVSVRGRLTLRADNQVVFDQTYVSGPEPTQGEKIVYKAEYKIYQNIFNQARSVALTRPATRLSLSDDEGDWVTLTSLSLQTPGGPVQPLELTEGWGQKQPTLNYDPGHPGQIWTPGELIDRQWLVQKQIAPWKELEAKGVGVVVGEWGCYDKTPHDVVLRWMEDNLINFKQAGWGWALWNFSGSFGVLDSGRPDVAYESYQGHKLDRQMLDLLQRY
jgi:hypothetical protein